MLVILLGYSLALVAIYIAVNVALVVRRNYYAHQFFKIHTPNLPTLEDSSIFHGHVVPMMRDKNYKYIDELHSRHGTTFGYYICEQPWVSTKDLDLLKHIELDAPHKHIGRSRYGVPIEEWNHSIFQVNGDLWRKIRRIVSPTLTNHSVRNDNVTSAIESVLNQLIEGFEWRLGKAKTSGHGERWAIVDVGNMFQRYALAVIFSTFYKQNEKINFISERDAWIDGIEYAGRQISNPFIQLGIMFPFLSPLLDVLINLHPFGRTRRAIVGFIHQATGLNRLARKEKLIKPEAAKSKRSLLDPIIDAFIDGKLNQINFVGTLLFLLLAGFETTADTMACLVWNLTQHPEIQEKLRKELLERGTESEYLHWCIQETVRFHPAVPLGVGRILGEDVIINGTRLAKGTFVMPSTWSIHRDPSIWPDADKFKPDRWQHAASFHPAAFMGFGLGPRNCVGAKLAVHETKLLMVALLARYRFEKCDQTPSEYAFSSPGLLFTNHDEPIKVKMTAL